MPFDRLDHQLRLRQHHCGVSRLRDRTYASKAHIARCIILIQGSLFWWLNWKAFPRKAPPYVSEVRHFATPCEGSKFMIRWQRLLVKLS